MKTPVRFVRPIFSWIASGLAFFLTVFALSVAYSAYTSIQSVQQVSTGSGLSASEWNKVAQGLSSLNSQMVTVDSVLQWLGTLSTKSAVTSAEITDGSVSTADIANSSVTDAKISAGILPSKIAQSSATSGQVLKWNWSAWAPAADSTTSGANCTWYSHGQVFLYPAGCDTFIKQCWNGSIVTIYQTAACGSTCFPWDTKVLLASWIWKNISEVEVGEKVIGKNGSLNSVTWLWRPKLGDRQLVSFNGDFLSTKDHMFRLSDGWWSAVDPDFSALRRYGKEVSVIGKDGIPFSGLLSGVPRSEISPISIGTRLLLSDGNSKTINSLDVRSEFGPDTQLYTLMTDGTSDFTIQGGYLADGMPQK